MARSSTTWKKGQSGRAQGSLPPVRPLASALQVAGNRPDEEGVTPKEKVSNLIWEFMQRGGVVFQLPDGETRELRARTIQEWIDGMKFVYRHLDGDAPRQISLATPDLDLTGFAYEQLEPQEKEALREALKQAASVSFDPEEVEGTVEA